jgi:hypothetical protein
MPGKPSIRKSLSKFQNIVFNIKLKLSEKAIEKKKTF